MPVVCDRYNSLNTAADAAQPPFTAGIFRIKQELIQEHDLTNRLHVCMWLLITYAIPPGMYASQPGVWANSFLQTGQRNG